MDLVSRTIANPSRGHDSIGGADGLGSTVKAVILAGGLGTRLSEETSLKPKPMVEVGGKPILWHILKLYRDLEI